MQRPTTLLIVALFAAVAMGQSQPASPAARIVVFDFAGAAALGPPLADSIRLRLARHGEYDVIDRLTTQEAAGPTALDADPDAVADLTRKLAGNVAIFGTVTAEGKTVTARARLLDLRGPSAGGWVKTFADGSERSRGEIARRIVEEFRGQPEWTPPQYGDEPTPATAELGRPLNANGDFSAGEKDWDRADNVSTFIQPEAGRGDILRIRTDLEREPWLQYKRKLLLGQADPSKPPSISRDTSYGCVGGLEGVHYAGQWIPATPGQRYWLLADARANARKSETFTPKIFVKGFSRTEQALDGLPESSLAALGLTPEQFAALPRQRRDQLIREDARKNPMRYLRETYRWYLNLRGVGEQWQSFAAPMPPRGGLPANVEWLQIQVYAYWPPGEYFFDNVQLYRDPRQQATQPAQAPRTPNFGKTSDVVERSSAPRP